MCSKTKGKLFRIRDYWVSHFFLAVGHFFALQGYSFQELVLHLLHIIP